MCEEGGGAGKIVRLLKLPNHESDQYKEHRPIVAVVNKNRCVCVGGEGFSCALSLPLSHPVNPMIVPLHWCLSH